MRTFVASRTRGSRPAPDVGLDERGQGPFGLGPDGQGDPRWDQVEDDHPGPVRPGEGVGEGQGQLGVGSAADRDQDPLDVVGAALLDDRDVAGRLAHDRIDRRAEHRRAVAVGARPVPPDLGSARAARRPGSVATRPGHRLLPAPAEDDEVRLLLGGRLDDPLGGVPADPDDRVDRGPRRRVVEHALEEAPGVASPGGPFRQGHPLGHLDDAQGVEPAGATVHERGTDPDELLGGARVRDRDEDAGRQRGATHVGVPDGPGAIAAAQRSTRYGLSSSNSRAWRSTRSSAASVVTRRFSMTKLPTRPK